MQERPSPMLIQIAIALASAYALIFIVALILGPFVNGEEIPYQDWTEAQWAKWEDDQINFNDDED